MRTLAEDTHPEAERVLIELLRSASPARKIAMALANRTARTLALTGLRERHPNDLPARLRRVWQSSGLAPSSPQGPTARCRNMNEGETELLAAVGDQHRFSRSICLLETGLRFRV